MRTDPVGQPVVDRGDLAALPLLTCMLRFSKPNVQAHASVGVGYMADLTAAAKLEGGARILGIHRRSLQRKLGKDPGPPGVPLRTSAADQGEP